MKRMSFSETIFLFILALVVFGPKKLPEIARQIGKALNEFRRASNEFKAQIEQEIHNIDIDNKRTEAQKQASLPSSSASAAAPASLALSGGAPEGTTSRSGGENVSTGSVESSAELSSAESNSSGPSSGEASESATLAASSENQIASHAGEPATEALPGADASTSSLPPSDLPTSDVSAAEPVTSPTAQESHV